MRPELAALLRRIESAVPRAVRAGAEALADEARRHAGPLADGVAVGPVHHDGSAVVAAVESHPVAGATPPQVREFGSARTPPQPYMRPAGERADAIMGPAIRGQLDKL